MLVVLALHPISIRKMDLKILLLRQSEYSLLSIKQTQVIAVLIILVWSLKGGLSGYQRHTPSHDVGSPG